MRILHVDTATEWRGGQNQIVLTAEGQAAAGHEVRIFANTLGELAARASKASLAVHAASVGRGDLSFRTLAAIRAAAKAFAPDVIHVHESHGIPGAILAARAASSRAAASTFPCDSCRASSTPAWTRSSRSAARCATSW